MKRDSKLRKLWWQLKFSPFVGPMVAGWAALTMLMEQGMVYYALFFIWAALWAVLEHVALRGWPPCRVRRFTPNFWAVLDFSGRWRIFQRRPEQCQDCKELLRELLADQERLPVALTPGRYRALTHGTILGRLQRMENVAIQSCRLAYVATLEETISQAMGKRCRHCADRCPFPGRCRPRQFYDIRFQVKEENNEYCTL